MKTPTLQGNAVTIPNYENDTTFDTTDRHHPGANLDPSRRNLRDRLLALDIHLTVVSLERTFQRMTEIATPNDEVTDDQLRTIVDDVVTGTEILHGVAESFR